MAKTPAHMTKQFAVKFATNKYDTQGYRGTVQIHIEVNIGENQQKTEFIFRPFNIFHINHLSTSLLI